MATSLLSVPFRPFFVAAALQAIAGILVWLLFLRYAQVSGALLPDPFLWHGHTMITGFAGAIIAGFLLTASANWAGRPTTTPLTLSILIVFWLTGRVADFIPQFSPWISLVGDAGFWLLTDFLLLRVIIIGRNWRNIGFGLLPLAFFAVDLAWHLDHIGLASGIARPALWIGVDLLVVIMGAMGGRVIPFFTRNRLPDARVSSPQSLALATNILLVLVLATNVAFRGEALAAMLMVLAGVVLLARLALWDSVSTRREPMLWILHLGYAWLGVALLLRATAIYSGAFAESTALHAVTVGALGALGLGMLVRVALGHTGRPIQADRLMTIGFLLVSLAAVARLASIVDAPAAITHGVASWLWMFAFLLYLWRFLPILVAPRL